MEGGLIDLDDKARKAQGLLALQSASWGPSALRSVSSQAQGPTHLASCACLSVPPSSLPARGVFSAERAEPRCAEFGRLGEIPEVPADETVRLRCLLLQAAFFLAVSHSIVTYNSSPGKKSHSSHTSSAPGRFSKCLLFPHIQIYILIRRFFGASALSTGILLPNPAPEFVSLHPHHSAVLPTPR